MVAVMAAALAGGSSAEQLNIGLRTVTGYSSNVFGRVDDTVSGSIYSLAGDFELEADRRVWSYDLQYSPRVNGRGDENERVALAHRATLRGRFSPTQRIQVKGSSRVIHEQDFRFDLEEEGLDPGEIATNDARQVTRLWNDVSVTRRMSPRLSLTGGARVTVAEFEDEDRSDNLGFSGNASASYVWSDRLNLGLGYTRSEQPTLGNSSTSIFDEVRVYASLPLSARWRVFLNGSWVRSQLQQFIIQPQNSYPQLGITGTSPNNGAGRELLVIQRVDSEQRLRQDLMVWRMATSLEHRLTRRLRLTGRFEYRRRDTDIDSLVGDTRERGFDDYRGVLTIRYTWDPIRL